MCPALVRKNRLNYTLYAALYQLFVSKTGLGRKQKDHLVVERMRYVTEAASFLWSKSLLRKDGEMERQHSPTLEQRKAALGE